MNDLINELMEDSTVTKRSNIKQPILSYSPSLTKKVMKQDLIEKQ